MPKIRLSSTNKEKAYLITFIIVLFACVTIFLPLILGKFIPQSIIGSFININLGYILVSIPILFYFIFTGIFVYQLNIDPYIINISSYRSVSSIFFKINYVDIAHVSLKEYAFFNRSFTLNKTLMIKIKTDRGKIITQRFTLTLLGNKEQKRISRIFDQILSNNN